MDIEKEKKLVGQAKKGNIKAFEQLVLEHEKIVYNIIYRIMDNEEDTYDLSQETFIKAYTKINQFNEESRFSTWLYRIATNTSLDELRKRKGKETYSIDKPIIGEDNDMLPEYIDENENVEKEIIGKEKNDVIECAFKELNKNNKIILNLREIQGLSYDEISKVLGISLGTVKSRISRARQEMKNILMQDKEPYATYFRQNTIRRDKDGL
mgnify:FL=1